MRSSWMLIVVASTACGKSDKAASSAPAGWREIPNTPGAEVDVALEVDAPTIWLDNGLGGSAGFHQKDHQQIVLTGATAVEATSTLADFKASTEKLGAFRSWISATESDGAIKLIYSRNPIGTTDDALVAFDVKRTIGTKRFNCFGETKDQATAEQAVAICTRVRVPAAK